MLTKALLLEKDLSLSVGSRELAKPGPDELIVAVDWAGVCGSDLHVLRTGDWVDYWPATLGHEVAGRVIESSSSDFPIGISVVLDSRIANPTPGGAEVANRLAKDLRWLGEARPGGFANALVIPTRSVRAVPDGLSTEDAVLTEPLAVAMCALDQVRATPRSVLIIGHGPIGALTNAEVGRRWPEAEATVIEPNPHRAQLARVMGADVVDRLEGAVFDLVIDAAGYPGSLTAAVQASDHGGTVLLVALAHSPSDVVPSNIVERSLTVIGSVGFDDRHLDEALAHLAHEPERYRGVVTHRIDLTAVPDFLTSDDKSDAIKVLIRCAQ